jgi:hypothetical protein
VFNKSISKADVLVMFRTCVIPVVHPVEIVLVAISSIKFVKSKSKRNLVNPLGAKVAKSPPK